MDLSFHFIKFKPTGAVLTMTDRNHKVRYMCFSSRETAVQCVEYISLFRSEMGTFPVMNLSGEFTKVRVPKHFKKRSVENVSKFFTIDTKDRDALDTMARATNAHFMYVHKFRFDREELYGVGFSGQDVDAYVDMDKYIETLEIM